MPRGLVVLSGGQDSFTTLGVALLKCSEVYAVSFEYGQKHEVELEAARMICRKNNIQHRIVDLTPALGLMKSSALVNHDLEMNDKHSLNANVPASFVPVRNALFLTVAYGVAMEEGCDTVWTGVCQTDYSGYPDCRADFISTLNIALNVGYQGNIQFMTPLMYINKAETFKLAEDVDILDDVLQYSVTCYEGRTDIVNEWGLGCGNCPACRLRAKGWEDFKAGRFNAEQVDGIKWS